jgi:excinuclease ABC subunit C
MLELDCGLQFFADFDADFFEALPARPGIFLLEMREDGAQPYLARTADIRRAAERLLSRPDTASKALNLREVVGSIRYRITGSKFEQTFAYYENARAYFPRRYRDLMRLRPPAMLKVNLRNAYPRCYVTRRIRADEGFYFGPFASRRLAEDFSEGFLDLFKTRRCQIKIRRDPDYPGCMYSEMKMCLAPCFAGCTKEEYDVEVGRLLATLESSGASLTEELAREREAASAALDFERAAALHKRLDKVSAALRGMPDIARRIEELDVVILQRASEYQTIAVFPVRGGLLDEPLFLRFAEISSEPRSVEAILKQKLEPELAEDSPTPETVTHAQREEEQPSVPPPASAADWRSQYGLRAAPPELPEHLSLIARWFYSKPRDGEILFRDRVWPYRRMLRACSRLLAGPKQTPQEKLLEKKVPPHPA